MVIFCSVFTTVIVALSTCFTYSAHLHGKSHGLFPLCSCWEVSLVGCRIGVWLLFRVSCDSRSGPNTTTARLARLASMYERLKARAINPGPDVGSQPGRPPRFRPPLKLERELPFISVMFIFRSICSSKNMFLSQRILIIFLKTWSF